MEKGFVDEEVMDIILKEVGIKTGFMNFEQFRELVGKLHHLFPTS